MALQANAQDRDPTEYLDPARVTTTSKLDFEMKPRPTDEKNFPIEMGYATPSHMGKPGEVWGVVRELIDTHGWTDEEIQGFVGGNLMRVYEANWK